MTPISEDRLRDELAGASTPTLGDGVIDRAVAGGDLRRGRRNWIAGGAAAAVVALVATAVGMGLPGSTAVPIGTTGPTATPSQSTPVPSQSTPARSPSPEPTVTPSRSTSSASKTPSPSKSSAASRPAPRTLLPGEVDGVTVGMSVREGQSRGLVARDPDGTCGPLMATAEFEAKYPGLFTYWTTQGGLRSMLTKDSRYATQTGARVGMTKSQLQNAYGSRLKWLDRHDGNFSFATNSESSAFANPALGKQLGVVGTGRTEGARALVFGIIDGEVAWIMMTWIADAEWVYETFHDC